MLKASKIRKTNATHFSMFSQKLWICSPQLPTWFIIRKMSNPLPETTRFCLEAQEKQQLVQNFIPNDHRDIHGEFRKVANRDFQWSTVFSPLEAPQSLQLGRRATSKFVAQDTSWDAPLTTSWFLNGHSLLFNWLSQKLNWVFGKPSDKCEIEPLQLPSHSYCLRTHVDVLAYAAATC